MAVPTKFRRGSPTISSYDWFDIAAGVAVKVFYAGDVNATVADTAGTRTLSSEKFYSEVGASVVAASGAGDYDFDITLNRPMTIEGDSVINIPVLFAIDGVGADSTASTTVTARVRHWDGSNETTLVSGSTLCSHKLDAGGGNINVSHMSAVKVTIPNTHFKAGETLRLTIEHGVPTNSTRTYIGHDPYGRLTIYGSEDGTTGTEWATATTTALTIQIPLLVDV